MHYNTHDPPVFVTGDVNSDNDSDLTVGGATAGDNFHDGRAASSGLNDLVGNAESSESDLNHENFVKTDGISVEA